MRELPIEWQWSENAAATQNRLFMNADRIGEYRSICDSYVVKLNGNKMAGWSYANASIGHVRTAKSVEKSSAEKENAWRSDRI